MPSPPREAVDAGVAVDDVVTGVAGRLVVARRAVDLRIVAVAAADVVVAGVAERVVVALATDDRVGALAVQGVVAFLALQLSLPPSRLQVSANCVPLKTSLPVVEMHGVDSVEMCDATAELTPIPSARTEASAIKKDLLIELSLH